MGSIHGEEDRSNQLFEAHHHARRHAMDIIPSMALRCALQLGIPDIISTHGGPLTLPELASQLSIPEAKFPQLNRVMRLLAHIGFFATQKNDQGEDSYSLTPSSELLVSKDRQTTLAPYLLLLSDPVIVTPCLYMADWFRGSAPTPFDAAHGVGVYEYMGKHPEFSATINEANASISDVETRGLLQDLIPKLEGFESLVDVGGGTGIVASIIAEATPHLKYTIFDIPMVVSEAKPRNNITFLAGDMFESIPSADIIFSKGVFTAFSDGECLKILKRCLEAVRRESNPRSKVVMIDVVRDQRKMTPESIKTQLCSDLMMMAVGDGKERTEDEWRILFLEAGFGSYTMTTPSQGLHSIIEVFQ